MLRNSTEVEVVGRGKEARDALGYLVLLVIQGRKERTGPGAGEGANEQLGQKPRCQLQEGSRTTVDTS